jgi:hypothetical protein
MMLDLASSISLCGSAVVFASGFLVVALLNQFSPVFRAISGKSTLLIRLSNGTLVGGIFFTASYAQDYLYYTYANATTPYISGNYYNYYVVAGMILLIVSAVLMATYYIRSRKLATKV